MDAEMKVLVWRDRDAKKTESRCSNRKNRNIAVIIAAVLLLTAFVGGIAASASADEKAEDSENVTQIAAEAVQTAENVTETADNVAAEETPVTAFVTPVLVAHEEYLGETDGMMIVDENAEYKLWLLSDGDEEDYLPAGKNIDLPDADSDEAGTDRTGAEADETQSGTDGETAETKNAAVNENKTADAVNGNKTSETVDDSADSGDEEISEEDLPTRDDEINEMVGVFTAPEDMPSKLTYKYNKAMQLNLSSEEITVLEKIVEAEATGEDVYGRMLVANVVINRVNSRYFPNDVKSVVFEKIGGSVQFSPIKDGRYYSVPVTEATKEAVRRVLSGEDYSRGALYFFERARTTSSKASWFDTNLKYLMKYGCHEFYTEYKE